jgi:hypothetical protein
MNEKPRNSLVTEEAEFLSIESIQDSFGGYHELTVDTGSRNHPRLLQFSIFDRGLVDFIRNKLYLYDSVNITYFRQTGTLYKIN